MTANALFRQALAETPADVSRQVALSFAIADKIAGRLRQLGMSQKDFARKTKKTEAEVSRWLSGTHNFTLRTLALISTTLDFDLIKT